MFVVLDCCFVLCDFDLFDCFGVIVGLSDCFGVIVGLLVMC